MPKPFELPWAELPHHALPLGEGRWRAPAPGTSAVTAQLQELGIHWIGELADGSGHYQVHKLADDATVLSQEGHPDDPAYRPYWIAARIAVAREACRHQPAPPQFFGILNLTPDSFSDGGQFGGGTMGPLYHAQVLRAEGIDILDLGAESTRPGAARISDEEQLQRLLPVIEALQPLDIPLSIDTRSAKVAERCLAVGASYINDVSGLGDAAMAPLLAAQDAQAVLMHMRGTPATMQQQTHYRHLLGEIVDEMMVMVHRGLAAGMHPDRMILDPGIGFAKDAVQSRLLIQHFGAFRALGLPLLSGPSRKSFLGDLLPGLAAEQRDGGTIGAAALCAAQGAEYLRLHRGHKAVDACKVAAACAYPQPQNGNGAPSQSSSAQEARQS
ncbi:MAG: dihydropteroate synthase [Planctomycetota bacterium]